MNRIKKLQKWIAFLCCLTLLAMPLCALGTQVVSAALTKAAGSVNGMVRVYLSSIGTKTTLNITANGSYSINGNVNQALSNGESLKISLNTSTGNITLTRNGQSTAMGSAFQLRRHSAAQTGGLLVAESLNASNPYPGDMLFTSQKSGSVYKLYAIANVFIEDYLYGVVPYEMGNAAHVEALKAQAVAARTYTFSKMNARAGTLYDVVDTTNDQVYRGTPTGNANCVAAVDGTRGIVSMAGNSLVETYYTASNGGQTESSQNAWGNSRSYLIVKDDPFDYANSDAQVKKAIVYADFSNTSQNSSLKSLLLSKAKTSASALGYDSSSVSIQKITNVVPHTPKYSSPSELYTYVDFFVTAQAKKSGTTNTLSLQLTCGIFSELESLLNMSINGTANELWSVQKSGSDFSLQARRFGHGIGLSQRGAMQMGRLGYTYADILGFYYTGSKRMQYTFTNTILAPISSGGSNSIVTEVEPAELADDDPFCTATVSLVNKKGSLGVYNAANISADIIGAVPNGAPLRIYAIDGDWCFIGFGQLYGYVQKSGLIITGTAPQATTMTPSKITEYAVVISNGYLNLRQGPSTNDAILGTAPEGAVLSVFSRQNGWAYIQYGSVTAYASENFLTFYKSYPMNISNPDENLATISLQNAGETVNMRDSASLSGAIIATLSNGAQVTVLKDDGSWCRVVYLGQTGYIMSSYLLISGAQPKEEPTAPQTPQTLAATIKADLTPIYHESNEEAEAYAYLTHGTAVTVDEYGMAWCKVRSGEISGYIKTAALDFSGGGTSQAREKATVVTVSGSLNLRTKPSAGSVILLTIPRLSVVDVLEKGDTWCKVLYSGVTGHVMTDYLRFAGDAMPETPQETPSSAEGAVSAIVTTASGSLNLRRGADGAAEILTTIPRGSTLSITEKGAVWCKTTYNGVEGYVMTSFLTFTEAQEPTPTPSSDEEKTESPTQGTQQMLFGTVTTTSGSLNLRQSDSANAKILGVIPRGAKLEIKQKYDAWSRVTYLGATGYVMNAYLTFSTEEVSAPPLNNNGQTATVVTASGGLNLRSGPVVGNNIILSIPRLKQVNVYERGTNWCYVAYNDSYGYVMTSYLSFSDAAVPDVVGEQGMATARVYTSNGGNLNLRDAANGKIIGSIPNNMSVTVLQKGESWTKISYLGSEGFVMTNYLLFAEAPTPESALPSDAAKTEKPAEQSALPIETEKEKAPGHEIENIVPPTPEPTPAPTPKPILDTTLKSVSEECYAMVDPAFDWMGIYKECSMSSELLVKAVPNKEILVLQIGKEWCEVKIGEVQGYCQLSALMLPE